MRVEEMDTLCEQLCSSIAASYIADPVTIQGLNYAKTIMHSLRGSFSECDRETYIWIFTHAAALGMQIEQALTKQTPLPGERWAEFISNNLRTH